MKNHYVKINVDQLIAAYRGTHVNIRVPSLDDPLGAISVLDVTLRDSEGHDRPEEDAERIGRLLMNWLPGVEDKHLIVADVDAPRTLADYAGQHVRLAQDDRPNHQQTYPHPVYVIGRITHTKLTAVWEGVERRVDLISDKHTYQIMPATPDETLRERVRDITHMGIDFTIASFDLKAETGATKP